MKTLFENLKEEHKMQLEVMKEIYPNLHAGLVKALEDNYLYSMLTLSEAFTLITITSNKGFSVNNLLDLFYE
jgi:hypothetical protein